MLVAGLILYMAAGLIANAVAGSHRVATGGDPHSVSAQRLKSELAGTGLAIHYLQPAGEPVPSVTGVAHDGKALLGFEFQLYPSSDEATVSDVGKLRAKDLGWPRKYDGFLLHRLVRGVLGNVAFAEYKQGVIESHYTVAEAHEVQLAHQHIVRALDNALFGSFPSNDPYAHALLAAPE